MGTLVQMQLKSSWGLPLTFDKNSKVFVNDSHACLRSTFKVRSCFPINFLPPSISPPNKNKAWPRCFECQAFSDFPPPSSPLPYYKADCPPYAKVEIDEVRKQIGVERGALIKVWLNERLKQEKAAHGTGQ